MSSWLSTSSTAYPSPSPSGPLSVQKELTNSIHPTKCCNQRAQSVTHQRASACACAHNDRLNEMIMTYDGHDDMMMITQSLHVMNPFIKTNKKSWTDITWN